MLGQNPTYTVTQLQSALTGAAQDLGSGGKDSSFGSGKLRVPSIVAPKITSFSPSSGPVGTVVTINGSALAGANDVQINGIPAAISGTPTATQVKAIVPPGAHTGYVYVATPDGSIVGANQFKVTPKITGFTPPSGLRGSSVVISGTTFTGATAVKFGSLTAAYTIDNDSQITATVPATATTNKLTVTTPAGTSTSTNNYTVILPPTISSFSPSSAPVGALVTANGSNLGTVTDATVNGTAAAITPVSATQLKLTVPAGAHTGPLQLTNPAGTGSSGGQLKVTPKITGFTPPSGLRGSSVVIAGTTFQGATAVKFGTVTAAFTVDDDSQITATVPATATTNKLSVTTPAGSNTSAASYTVILPPTVSSFTPTSAPVGALVTVNGSNLSTVSDATINGVPATITPVSATQLKLTIPAGAQTSKLTLTNPAGPTTSSGILKVTPKITGFTPPSGLRGSSVVISGTTFTGATAVKFGSLTAAYTIDNDSQITATVPATATTNKLTVTTPAGTSTSTNNYTVILPPTISSFTPTTGTSDTLVTVRGANLSGASDVTFNGLSGRSLVHVSDSELKVLVPPGAVGGKIGVTSPAGTGFSSGSFSIPVAITSMSPDSGIPGTLVVVTGVGFTRVTSVKFGNGAADFTIDGPTQITAVVPESASPGPIVVGDGTYAARSDASFTPIFVPVVAQRIVFGSTGFGGQSDEIVVVRGDGSAAARLTNSPGPDRMPVWSPDGSKIAFLSERDGNSEIYVMNADGSGQTPLLTRPATNEWDPAWSPDGTRIAFASYSGSEYDIWVVNSDGSGAVNITNDSGDDRFPSWSPDGDRIAFSSTRDGEYEIYTMDPDGGQVFRVTADPLWDRMPDWSPDGTRIVFEQGSPYVAGTLASTLLDGTDLTPLTSGGNDSSPSGTHCSRLVFLRYDGVTPHIFVTFHDGGPIVRIVSADSGFADCWEPG